MLRALTARIDALEVKMDSRFEAMGARAAAAEERGALRHEILLGQLEGIKNLLELDKRIVRLENQRADAPSSKTA